MMEAVSTLAMIGIGIFVIYTIISLCMFGVTRSLSETYYLWIRKNNSLEWPFRICLIITAFLLVPAMIVLGEGSIFQFTGFVTPFCLAMVGASADYLDTNGADKTLHPVMALICAVSSIFWEYFVAERIDFLLIVFAITLLCSLFTKTTLKSYIYWLEMTCFYSVFCCIIKIFYF